MCSSIPKVLKALKICFLLLILLCGGGVVSTAQAAVSNTTITFGTGHTDLDVVANQSGLNFSEWVYGTAIIPTNASQSGDFAIAGTPVSAITVVSGFDRFNATSVRIWHGYAQLLSIKGYRSGSLVASQDFVSGGDNFFHSVTLNGNFTNIDKLEFTAPTDNYCIDDLVVAPYLAPLTLSPTTLTAATVGVAYSPATITASGGDGSYTYSVGGGLPPGMSFSGAGVLSGTPTAGGTFNFTITSMDSVGAIGNQAYSFTVNSPTLSFSPTTLTAGTVATAYNQSVSVSGGTSPYNTFAIASGALPAGLSLNASNGAISGTPTAGGTFNFTVSAKDSSTGSGPYTGSSGTISLTIAAPTLNFSPATLTAATVGTAYSQSVSVTGGTTPYNTFAIASGALPAGLSLNASNGTISGTPTAGGSFNFTVSAQDSSSGTGPYTGTSSTITLSVASPVIMVATASLPAGVRANAYSQSITATGGTAPYSYALSAGSLPAGITLSSGGLISGTPTDEGTFSFTITATDNSGGTGPYSGSRAFNWTINPALPIANAVSATVAYGSSSNAISLNITGGTAASVAVASAASHGTATASGTSISYTPTAGYSGSDSFTYTATNASGTSVAATVTITVTPQAPVANAVSATVAYGSSSNAISLNITGGTAASVAVASAASHGTATASGTSISYTPTAGYSGSDSFTYTATNAGGTSVAATVTITVLPQTPVANSVSATVAYGSSSNAISLNITGGTAASVVVASAASHGTATASGTSISYTPTAGYSGSDSFTYTATNASGTSSAATVTITVTPQTPVANSVSATVAYGSSSNAISLNITGGSAASVTVASAASHGTATASGTSISYTPTAGYSGSDSFTYTATNAGGTSSAATVTITVTPQVPNAGGVALTVAKNSSANAVPLNLSGGVATSVTVAAGASHGTATATGTGITYTPNAGYFGADSFTYTATNAGGTSAAGTVSLTITDAPPVANSVSSTVAYGSNANPIALNITGATATSVAVVANASHGTATASGTSISYTPAAGYSGSDSFTYTATNTGGTSAAATVTITVTPQIPVANASSSTVAYGSSSNPISLSLSGGTAASVAVVSGASHGTATASGTSISYTPTAGYSGSDSFTYTATNAGGTSAAATVTITVTSQAPVANAVNTTVAYNSSANPVALNITGGPAASVAVASAASHGTATASGTSISYTPTAGYSGNDSFTYTATNSGGTSAAATVTITVTSQAPVANAVNATVAYNSSANPVTLNITGGPAVSVAVASGASHGTATASGTSISYTPTAGYSGSDSFTYTATNSGGTSAAATVTILVTAQAPVAGPVSATVAFGSSANSITPNLTGGAVSSIAVASQPAHGSASVSGTNLIYTPGAGYTGSDTFTYTATNAGGTSAAATVTITVTPQVPVAGQVNLTVAVNSLNNVVPLNLSGGVAVSVAVVNAPANGKTTVVGTTITYTPTSGYSGSDSFTYTASNAGGTSAPGTVNIIVKSRPDPSKDQEVIGLLKGQVATAQRFALSQIANFQGHLESLHSRKEGATTAANLTANRAGLHKSVSSTNTSEAMPRAEVDSVPSTNRSAFTQMGTVVEDNNRFDPMVLPEKKTYGISNLPWQTLNLSGKSDDFMGTGLEVWSAGVFNLGRNGNTDTRFTTSGVSFGTDLRYSKQLILGVGAGFGHERQKIGDNETRSTSDSYTFSVYGSYQPKDGVFVDGVIGFSRLDFDSQRYASAVDSFAQSRRKGDQWFSSFSGGYEYEDGALLLSPYSRLDLVSTRLKQATETGAGTYNLTYFEQTLPTTKLSLGLRGETMVKLDKGTAKPYFRVEFQHDFQKAGTAAMAYADELSGTVYQLNIDGVNHNALVLGLGSDFLLRDSWGLGVRYQFSHDSGSTQVHSFGANVKKAF